jgi:RHS repeat-associated protein
MPAMPTIFDRGYTGHEHLDKFELINMGGRVYDPVLARFLRPDPFACPVAQRIRIQAPEYGQNYNRYSYAFNNPLKFTDPNGEFGFLIFVGLSALMSAALSGSQPDGSFDWGEAGKGAFIGAAMPVGMMGSVLAPFSPALLGVSGALGSAALAGGAMFGSVTLTTGATSFATNGTFSPNLKAAGISAGITALFAGIEGGVRAANDNRNFWTGEGDYVPTYQTDNSPHTPLSVEVQQVELETSLAKMRTIPEDRLLPPVDIDYPVTSPYSEGNRYIEQLNQNRPHRAIDIGTPFGTPIQGPASGTVTFAGQTNYGKVVMLDHNYYYQGLQLSTSYSHLSSISVTQGMQIQMGQIIGYTGTYGTGPHLHFVVRIGGQRINPLLLFPYR